MSLDLDTLSRAVRALHAGPTETTKSRSTCSARPPLQIGGTLASTLLMPQNSIPESAAGPALGPSAYYLKKLSMVAELPIAEGAHAALK